MEKVSGITKKNFKIGTLGDFEKTYVLYVAMAEKPLSSGPNSDELLYLRNGISDHRNKKTKTLCNTKYPPYPGITHLRNHFWPLGSGFSAIATYKMYVFSKSPNGPILKFLLVTGEVIVLSELLFLLV